MPLNALDFSWWVPALQLYAGVLILGFAFWPWWTQCWKHREDHGAGLWLAGGVFTYVLLMQVLWRTGLLELHPVWAWLAVGAVGSSGYFLLPKTPLDPELLEKMRRSAWHALLVFTVLFWFWTLIRSADPGGSHTEQPMDVMWMRSAMASNMPPIRDSWFGGQPATYYAEGHQLFAFMALLFGMSPAVAINTGQILWFALTGTLAFQAGSSLAKTKTKHAQAIAGILCVLFLLFVSTLPGSIDALTQKRFWWWWDASRILFDGETSLITEFPFFSFYLGDMHAHLIGLPVLLLSLIASHHILRAKSCNVLTLLPMMVCIAWSWKINPWQTPTCVALPLLAFLTRGRRISLKEAGSISFALGCTLLLYWPRLAPGPPTTLALNTDHHISLWEWGLVFGFLLPGVLCSILISGYRFHLALIGVVIAMWAVCEIVFLQDVFQNRMNTIFKVYFQIWVLLAVVSAVGWSSALSHPRFRILAKIGLAVCLIPGLLYAGRLSSTGILKGPKGLHAWQHNPEAKNRLLTLADHFIHQGDLIIEAPGESYNPETSLLGTWTAGHTLLGWTGHQTQWRPGQPQPDPSTFYQAQSEAELERLLHRIDPQWIVVGQNERKLFDLHPDWMMWMDSRADRLVDDPTQILFRIR